MLLIFLYFYSYIYLYFVYELNNNNDNNCTLADSHVASAAREAGSVAELAASKKTDKYTSLAADYHFQPIAVEMLGPINKSASDFLTVLAHKISQRSGDEWETIFLFQRISVLLQRFNSILLHDSFVGVDCPE